jgi:xanthosine utilization system XapX-like protein
MSIAIQTTPHFNWERALIPARQRNIETRLNDIISRNVLTPQDVPTIKSALRISNGWTIWSGRVSSLLRQIDEKVILDFLSEVSKAPAGKEASFFIEKSLSFLSTQGLLDLSGLGNTEDAVVRYNADALTRPTVAQLAIVRKTIKLVKEFWIELKYFIHHMMDLCIGATGLNTLVRPKHHRWETSSVPTNEYVAMNQMKSYQTLLYSPTLLFGLIYAYVAIKTAAVAATAIAAVGIVALSIGYQRYWKPCPIDHEGLKNLSIAMLRQQEPNYVRQDILDQIQAAFESKKGVLLVGEPGVGKTWIAQSLAQQLNEGKLCTFIKDPHMFSCNGATLKSISEISPLQGIETRFEQHAENVVFFIDEFHAIFDEKEALKTGASSNHTKRVRRTCERKNCCYRPPHRENSSRPIGRG